LLVSKILSVLVCVGSKKHQEGVQFLSDDFLYSAEKSLSNWTINSNFYK